MKVIRIIACILLLSVFSLINVVHAQSVTLIPKWTAQRHWCRLLSAENEPTKKKDLMYAADINLIREELSFQYLKKRAEAVITNLSQALMEYFAGKRIVNILQTSQENSLMLVSHSPLKGIPSLQHREVAVWNHITQELLDRIANKYQIEVEWIRFNSGINLFLSKAVDICMVGSYNEFPQLAECGMQIDSTHIMRFADYGYNLPEDGLYVTEEFYQKHPETIQKLVRACTRGWNWANEHPEETLDIVMEQVHHYNIGTNRYHQRKMLEEILRLQTDKTEGNALID